MGAPLIVVFCQPFTVQGRYGMPGSSSLLSTFKDLLLYESEQDVGPLDVSGHPWVDPWVSIWWIYGEYMDWCMDWYMVNIWIYIYIWWDMDWYMVDIWLIYEYIYIYIWWDMDWYMVDLWLIYEYIYIYGEYMGWYMG